MKLHHSIAHLFGYELTNIRKHHPTLEAHLQMLISVLKINAVIDVGANQGQYGHMLRKIGYKENIYSFEPVKKSFQALEKISKQDAHWHVFNCALGEEAAQMEINVMEASEFSSLLTPNTYGKEQYAHKIPIKYMEVIDVKRLDDVLYSIMNQNEYDRVFLKMDTQGYDLKVLAGAEKILNRVIALQSEASVMPIYEGMPDYVESFGVFRQLGFALSGIYPVNRDTTNLQLVELDCVLIKSKRYKQVQPAVV